MPKASRSITCALTESLHEVVEVLAAEELVAFAKELFTGHDDRLK